MEFDMGAKDKYESQVFTKEEEELRQEIRDFAKKEVTPEVRQRLLQERDDYYGDRPQARELGRKIGARGWSVPTWPEEYGGLGCSEREGEIIYRELSSQGLSGGGYGGIQGVIIMRNGTEEQKREYLPKIARSEISFALGYSEPNAGTDLASLEMRAVADGDDYIINGQKVYSTNAHVSTHHWLAARTNADAPRHRGISLFVVDLKTPGITIVPMLTIAGEQTYEVFYDNVRVPKTTRIGEEDQAWSIIRDALGVERMVIPHIVNAKAILDELIEYAKETKPQGTRLTEDPIVRQRLAQCAIEVHVRRLYDHLTRWMLDRGDVPQVEAAIQKVFGHESDQRLAYAGMQILGLYGQLEPSSKWAPLAGKIEHLYRFVPHLSFGGGSHELMRVQIATRRMGLPRG